jgi:small-conductance mechanosensitive channel
VAVKAPDAAVPRSARSKERALESIATRFSIMRRVSTPLVFILTGALLGIPFLGNIPAAAVTLLATAFTIVVGIAAKPLLENLIAGLMISFSQPLRIGDLLMIQGQYGIVEEINLTFTVIKIWDWRRFVIPNQRLLQIEYENHTLIDKWQWSYVPFWVDYSADLDEVQQLAIEAVRQSPHNVSDHAPGFWTIDFEKEGIVCWVAGWVKHPLEAWSLKHEVRTNLVRMFKEHGIRAHMYNVNGPQPLSSPESSAF